VIKGKVEREKVKRKGTREKVQGKGKMAEGL